MMHISRTCPLAVAILFSLFVPLTALQVHEFEKSRHLRFVENTFPGEPENNNSLWADSYVFEGVGWSADDTRKGFALISPRHFVGANHFRPTPGSEIQFLSTSGDVRSYTYETFHNIQNTEGEETDLFIGELSENIPASHGIPLYPVLDESEGALRGREIVVYGRGDSGPRIGRGEIERFGNSLGPPLAGSELNDTRNYTFEYTEAIASQDDAYGEVGDSGSPSFVPVDDMLTVSGIHSAVLQASLPGTGDVITTYDSFILHYKDQINDHLAKTGHRLILAPLGETGLEISDVRREGDEIVLQVENPGELPYDIHRATNLESGDWEVVATSRTENSWTGEVPAEEDRVFWRLVRYPLPIR